MTDSEPRHNTKCVCGHTFSTHNYVGCIICSCDRFRVFMSSEECELTTSKDKYEADYHKLTRIAKVLEENLNDFTHIQVLELAVKVLKVV